MNYTTWNYVRLYDISPHPDIWCLFNFVMYVYGALIIDKGKWKCKGKILSQWQFFHPHPAWTIVELNLCPEGWRLTTNLLRPWHNLMYWVLWELKMFTVLNGTLPEFAQLCFTIWSSEISWFMYWTKSSTYCCFINYVIGHFCLL